MGFHLAVVLNVPTIAQPQAVEELPVPAPTPAVVATATAEPDGIIRNHAKGKGKGKGKAGGAASGASTVSSGIKLENVSITFKNQQVLRNISWDVKVGERAGLVGASLFTKLPKRPHIVCPCQCIFSRPLILWRGGNSI